MPSPNLPFPGYSWPFTQHAIALKPKTLYGLLTCASFFEGEVSPGRKITEVMIKKNLLTPNIRDGHADAWRDYQQVLAELGLIYSTKVERNLKLTSAGKMYLSGEIGFSELMTTQALRYQYPNGQKYDLQSRLREEVGNEIGNQINLYISAGVCIKPATLIARVLIELEERKEKAILTINECLAFLLPLKNNIEWKKAVENILKSRKNTQEPKLNNHARRNIQDWYKFLGMTDFFSTDRSEIRLSSYGHTALLQLKKFCDSQSQPQTFWYPSDSSKSSRIEWFKYFGEVPFELEIARPLDQISIGYAKENYVGGLDEDTENETTNVGGSGIVLQLFEKSTSRAKMVGMRLSPDIALSNLEQGIARRNAKTLIHQEMVTELAQHLEAQGAKVYEDRDSLDLLAVWPDRKETLFEVKTITQRNVQQRIRAAVGQLEEYSYRRIVSNNPAPDKVLVVNAELPEDSWYLDFLTKHMNIALVSKTMGKYSAHLPDICESSLHWRLQYFKN